jgi:hypothetical protein
LRVGTMLLLVTIYSSWFPSNIKRISRNEDAEAAVNNITTFLLDFVIYSQRDMSAGYILTSLACIECPFSLVKNIELLGINIGSLNSTFLQAIDYLLYG